MGAELYAGTWFRRAVTARGSRHLPVQPALWTVVVREVDDRQFRQPETRCNDFVCVSHPGCSPDQRATQCQQSAAVRWLKAIYQRITRNSRGLRGDAQGKPSPGRPGTERNQRAIDIQEEQRTVVIGDHPREREPEPAVLSPAEESETSADGCVLLTSEWAEADAGSLHEIGCARGLEPDAA
jgi:hypothetical protein